MTERAKKLLLLYYKQSRKIRRVSGLPPLTFKAKKAGTLKDYRIYGNTAGGESVGDLVAEGEHAGEYNVAVKVEGKNLFDYNTVTTGYRILWATGQPNPDATATISDYIAVNSGTYAVNSSVFVACYDNSKNYLGIYSANGYVKDYSLPVNYIVLNSTCSYIRIFDYNRPGVSDNTISQTTMLNAGSTPLPYEPYHAPITTPIYLPEQIKMVGNEAEYVDYAEQKWHRVRKNLLQNTATSQTINGITFTVNEDGSVTCNGTATNIVEEMVFLDFLLPPGNYRLTGCPPGGWSSYPGGKVSYCLRVWYAISENITWLFDYGDGCNFTLTDTKKMRSSIVIEKAQVVDNITFYPMIRKADIEDDTYEPYIENTEVDVTLPALPTLSGTNTLTVGTEVQPSGVEIKGRIKAAGGD